MWIEEQNKELVKMKNNEEYNNEKKKTKSKDLAPFQLPEKKRSPPPSGAIPGIIQMQKPPRKPQNK